MNRKLLAIVVAASFVAASGAAWGQAAVGGNTVPKYPAVTAVSKNKTHTKHGVGGNAVPTYAATEASKNKKVTNHGVGGNTAPAYPATSK
jgi:F0F1-type ATP synthase assembly protein I